MAFGEELSMWFPNRKEQPNETSERRNDQAPTTQIQNCHVLEESKKSG